MGSIQSVTTVSIKSATKFIKKQFIFEQPNAFYPSTKTFTLSDNEKILRKKS